MQLELRLLGHDMELEGLHRRRRDLQLELLVMLLLELKLRLAVLLRSELKTSTTGKRQRGKQNRGNRDDDE